MNRFECWILKYILKKEVINHSATIYSIYREAWSTQFSEDNEVTTDNILREMFEKSQYHSMFTKPKISNIRCGYCNGSTIHKEHDTYQCVKCLKLTGRADW